MQVTLCSAGCTLASLFGCARSFVRLLFTVVTSVVYVVRGSVGMQLKDIPLWLMQDDQALTGIHHTELRAIT
jgi:hypothetical protein